MCCRRRRRFRREDCCAPNHFRADVDDFVHMNVHRFGNERRDRDEIRVRVDVNFLDEENGRDCFWRR